jgi:peptidoglycan/xylan/chitin deacetylase (PgdA/CDA1 family)
MPSLRFRIKRQAQNALARLPASPFKSPGRVVVLCYHSISPFGSVSSPTPEMFDRQMAWLKENCRIVSFADALPSASGGSKKPTVAVTFDDGFADNFFHALPILLRYEIPATFFVTTGLIQRDPRVITRLGWADWGGEESTLTWSQIREMRNAGMEFGGHSHTHLNLAQASDALAISELLQCKEILEEQLQNPIEAFAYPFGRPRRHFTHRTERIAESVGYRWGAAVLYRAVQSTDDPLCIPRFAVTDDPPQMLRAKVLGKLDVMGWWQEKGPMWGIRVVAGRHF